MFPATDGRPSQRILADPPVPLTVRHLEPDALDAAFAEEVHRPFDLEAGPPWRLAVLGAGPEEHVLLIVLHHITADEQSLLPLTRDLAAGYAARARGRTPSGPDCRSSTPTSRSGSTACSAPATTPAVRWWTNWPTGARC